MSENERKKYTAADLAGNKDGRGVVCAKCGCRHFEVRNTEPILGDKIRRYRVCRHCGKVITTIETALGK